MISSAGHLTEVSSVGVMTREHDSLHRCSFPQDLCEPRRVVGGRGKSETMNYRPIKDGVGERGREIGKIVRSLPRLPENSQLFS